MKVLLNNIFPFGSYIAINLFGLVLSRRPLSKVERNKAKLHEMEIIYSDKTFEVASMSRRSEVEKRLAAMGSKVKEPERQAIALEKR